MILSIPCWISVILSIDLSMCQVTLQFICQTHVSTILRLIYGIHIKQLEGQISDTNFKFTYWNFRKGFAKYGFVCMQDLFSDQVLPSNSNFTSSFSFKYNIASDVCKKYFEEKYIWLYKIPSNVISDSAKFYKKIF